MKIYLDDLRVPTDTYYLATDMVVVRSYYAFRDILAAHAEDITFISFDHDLGQESYCPERGRELSGYDCLCLVEELLAEGRIKKAPEMRVHSDNPSGRQRIKSVIDDLTAYYQ